MSDLVQENELSFKELFDAFPDAHLLVEKGRIVACNTSACRMLGFSSKEELLSCIPADISGVYQPDGRRSEDRIPEVADQALREGSLRLEWVSRRCNGEEFPTELMVTRIPREGRELFYVVFHEITERKRTEETLKADQAFLRKVIDAVPGFIGVKNREGVFQLANREIARIYGTTVEELVGKRDADFIKDPEALEKFLADDREVIDNRREKFIPEEKLTDPEGREQWLSTVKVPLVDDQGNCSQVLLVAMHINELKRAEVALKASESKYRQLHESMRDAFVRMDMDGRIQEFNEAYRTMLGYEAEELRSLTYMDLTPEKWHAVEKDITEKQTLTRGYSDIYEKEYRRKDGTIFPVELRTTLLRDDSGATTGMWAIVRDITERKQAEEALKITQFAMDHASECIIWITEKGGFVYVNHAACRDLGYSREELLSLTVPDIDPDFSMDHWVEHRKQIRGAGFHIFETRHRAKDGRIFPVEVSVYIFNYGGKEYSCTFSRDITQRKQNEAALKASESKYRQLHESMRDAFVRMDLEGRLQEFNEVYRTMLGYETEELQSLTCRDLTPEKWCVVEKDILEKQILVRGYSDLYEKEYRRKDGTVFPVEMRTTLLRDGSGSPVGMWAIVRDITERKQIEEALKTTQFAMDHATESIMWITQEGRFFYANHAACRRLGYSREELMGMTPADIDPDFSMDRYFEHRQRVKAVGFETFESRHRTKDGRIFPVEINIYIFSYGGKEYSCTFSRDITQRKQHEAAMQKANEELEVRVRERTAELVRSNEELARFAHVASHDLQEPLRMVASYCQLLEMRYKDRLDEEGLEFIGYAVEGAKRMQCLIRDLLSYSQVNVQGRPFAPVAMETVVADVLQCLKIALEESGGRVTHDPLPEVSGDKIQLLQVFQNLIENALKFRREGVRPEIHISAQARGGEWVFEVRDNGIGIEPQYFERIFVIFQRLHSRQKFPGTGMGLALVKRIVERHGGRVWVESKVGAGTTFYFTLPG